MVKKWRETEWRKEKHILARQGCIGDRMIFREKRDLQLHLLSLVDEKIFNCFIDAYIEKGRAVSLR